MDSEKIQNALVGKSITRWHLDPDRTRLTLWWGTTGDERVHLRVYGDCCSHSWIESIDAPEVLEGEILGVEEIPMPDLGRQSSLHHPEAVDCVKYYGLKITTRRGRCVIDYRNDSNGYYGGWMEVSV